MTAPVESGVRRFSVSRRSRQSTVSVTVIAALVVLLVTIPTWQSTNVVQQLTSLLITAILAVMWNALAGYGGMVSVGQQAFIGIGAYGTIFLTQHGVTPYLAMVIAAFVAGAVGLPVSLLVLRLRGGQFAIGTWVVAEVFALLIILDQSLGGGTGTSLLGLNVYGPQARQKYTYWLTLSFFLLLCGLVFALLRSRHGAALQAIRDDEVAAAALGVRVQASKRVLFVLAAFGCGAAGALILASTLFVQPQSIFGVQYSAYMIFMVLVGGLGTFEGPLIGAVVLFAIQYRFADSGAWYLIGLGATAIAFALFLPKGIWGAVQERFRTQLLPTGYRLIEEKSGASQCDASPGGADRSGRAP
jgi:branched-chain amino acid transport system permease protein